MMQKKNFLKPLDPIYLVKDIFWENIFMVNMVFDLIDTLVLLII